MFWFQIKSSEAVSCKVGDERRNGEGQDVAVDLWQGEKAGRKGYDVVGPGA